MEWVIQYWPLLVIGVIAVAAVTLVSHRRGGYAGHGGCCGGHGESTPKDRQEAAAGHHH